MLNCCLLLTGHAVVITLEQGLSVQTAAVTTMMLISHDDSHSSDAGSFQQWHSKRMTPFCLSLTFSVSESQSEHDGAFQIEVLSALSSKSNLLCAGHGLSDGSLQNLWCGNLSQLACLGWARDPSVWRHHGALLDLLWQARHAQRRHLLGLRLTGELEEVPTTLGAGAPLSAAGPSTRSMAEMASQLASHVVLVQSRAVYPM